MKQLDISYKTLSIFLRKIVFCSTILCSLNLAGQANHSPLVQQRDYLKLLKQLEGNPPEFILKEIRRSGMMSPHLFNISYARSIGSFIQYKNTFHYSIGKSDIPKDTTPVSYLLSQIKKYEKHSNYKVAILYYDLAETNTSLETESLITQMRKLPGDENIEEADLGITQADLIKKVRVWYLSSKHLTWAVSGYRLQTLYDGESAMRNAIGVNAVSESRSPRGLISTRVSVPLDTLAENSGQQSWDAISKCLLPGKIKQQLEKDGISGVIIIPYANIGQLPFHCLKLQEDSGQITYFVDKYAHTILPHLCNFNKVFTVNKTRIGYANGLKTNKSLIVGNPNFYSDMNYDFPNLPGAETEAKAIALKLGMHAYIGSEANYDSVIKYLAVSDFAYFATHAVPSFEDPMNGSFLALTPSGKQANGYLTMATIQKKASYRNKLVVLSACQTGIGKAYKNGYCNIGRGFFIAGVDNTLMSLWNLDDANIVPFMTTVMEELQKPQQFYPAENLRQAVLKFKNTNANPAFWGAMVNFGICY